MAFDVLQEMKNTSKHLFWVIPLVLAVSAIVVSTSREHIDLSGDEPPFDSLELPPRSVKATTFLDGGSVWVHLIDREGKSFDFAFPYELPAGGSAYPTAFYGAKHSVEAGAIPFSDPVRAKQIVLRLMNDYHKVADGHTTGTYYCLAEEEPPLSTKIINGALSSLK